MEKITRIRLQNLMINRISFFIFCLFGFLVKSQTIIEDFNADKIKDTLSYKCYNVDSSLGINEPTCKCKIVTGKFNKKYNFSIFYVSDITISSCGIGCISVYDASNDTEKLEEYYYYKKYDDWILKTKEVNEKYNNKKIKITYRKKIVSISGKKMKK